MTKQVFRFTGLPQMVATSDLVIRGTVQRIEPGRILGDGDAAIQVAQVTLSVGRILFGETATSIVMLEEYGLERGHPSLRGDVGVYFLHRKTDAPDFYRLVNSQGRFLEDGTGGLVAIDDGAAWVRALEGRSLSQLERGVEDAARAVLEGRVRPARPILGSG